MNETILLVSDLHNFPVEDFLFRSIAGSLVTRNDDLPGKAWLAGGSLRRAFEGRVDESDYDLFFRSKEDLEWADKYLAFNGYKEAFRCPIGTLVTYKDAVGRKIQLIGIAYFPTPEAVIDSFDLTVSQLATDGEKLWMGEFTRSDLNDRVLRIHKLSYPLATLRRCMKYSRYGYDFTEDTATDFLITKFYGAVSSNTLPLDSQNAWAWYID